MPVYVYKCQNRKCGVQNLVRRGMNEAEPVNGVKCVKCKGPAKRVFTAPSLIIK